MRRQGDLLIIKVDHLPNKIKMCHHHILAEGEVTGHRHELDGGQVYEAKNELYFSVGEEKVTLTHQEHAPLEFVPGTYKVIRQREYKPEGWRYVAD